MHIYAYICYMCMCMSLCLQLCERENYLITLIEPELKGIYLLEISETLVFVFETGQKVTVSPLNAYFGLVILWQNKTFNFTQI